MVGAQLPAVAVEGVLAQVARVWKRDDLEAMVRESPLIEVTITGPAA